ncbi:MAG: lysophospholipid acyltransferase family protein [Chitinophagaceae bacterium]
MKRLPLIRFISRAPMGFLYLVSDLIFIGLYYFPGYRKKIVQTNLIKSFPEKNQEQIRHLTREFYHRFADFLVETLKGITISDSELRKRVAFTHPDILQSYFDQGKSVLMAATHHFNWEWALLAGCEQFSFPIDVIYSPLSNQKMEQLIYGMRTRFGGQPIPKENAVREILRRSKQVRAIAINADQVPPVDGHRFWTSFLHQDTSFYMGLEQIAKLTGYPVLFMASRRVARGYYEIEFLTLAQPPYSREGSPILEAYVCQVEKLIREDPANWLWSHRRWKHQRPPQVAIPGET